MAKILFTAFLADARGKVAGTVFSKNKSGAYARTKVTPANPRSPRQSAVRAALSSLSSGWRALTQDQRDQWVAATADYSSTNQFGNAFKMSGANLFIALNANLTTVGETAIDSPVAPSGSLTIPITMAHAGLISDVTLAMAVPADYKAVIRATPPVSVGRKFVSNLYRVIQIIPSGGPLTTNVTLKYNAAFGLPPVGQRVGFQVYLVNTKSGQKSTPFDISVIATI